MPSSSETIFRRALLAFLLLVCSFLSAVVEFPGALPYKVFATDGGFSGGIPITIEHDLKGFLWVGTATGLYRLEGGVIRQQVVGCDPYPHYSRLLRARDGGLWIVSRNKLLYGKDGKYQVVSMSSWNMSEAGTALDREGYLWVATAKDLWREDAQGAFRRMGAMPEIRARKKNPLSVGAVSGVLRCVADYRVLEFKDGRWETLAAFPEDYLISAEEDGTGCLWVASAKKLYRWPQNAAQPQDVTGLLNASVFSQGFMDLDHQGRLWIPTHDGLLAVRGDEHEQWGHAKGLPQQWIIQSSLDREGNLWMAGPKLLCVPGGGQLRNYADRKHFPGAVAWAIRRDRKGVLWAAANNGLYRLGASRWVEMPGTEGVLFRCLAEDAQGAIWAGSNFANLLVKVPPGAGKIQKIVLLPSVGLEKSQADRLRGAITVGAMHCDRDGRLWLGCQGAGLLKVDSRTARVLEVVDLGKGSGLGMKDFFSIQQDGKGRLWVCGDQGLFCYAGAWVRLAEGLKSPGLKGFCLSNDPDEVLAYYGNSFGVVRVRLQDGKLLVAGHLGLQDGLFSEAVYTMAKGSDGVFWMGTDKGLSRLSFKEAPGALKIKRLRHFDQGSGMVNEDCAQNSLWLDANGDAWVGTMEGIGHFIAGKELPLPAPPVTYLLSIEKGRQRHYPPFTESRIPYREATLEFHVDTPSIANGSQLRVQTRLVGMEDEWRKLEGRSSRYHGLSPGKYRFEARAGWVGEAWGPVISYTFTVVTPWWRSWWMITLGVLLVFVVATAYVKVRIRRLSRDKAKLEALVVTRTRELQVANHKLQEVNRTLETMSLVDKHTGLYNRRYLSLVMKDEAAKVIRAYRGDASGRALPNQDLMMFLVDLDNFTRINDRYGHAVGDDIIRRTAELLRSAAREMDVVVRMDGESFLLLAKSSSRKDASVIAERIRGIMAEQVVPRDDGDIRWTCSIGFAAFPFHPSHLEWLGWEDVMEIADACLGYAKNSGRNSWLGVNAQPDLNPVVHGPQMPWEMEKLVNEGVLDVVSLRPGMLKARRYSL